MWEVKAPVLGKKWMMFTKNVCVVRVSDNVLHPFSLLHETSIWPFWHIHLEHLDIILSSFSYFLKFSGENMRKTFYYLSLLIILDE